MKKFTIIVLLFSLLGIGFYVGYIFYGKQASDLKIQQAAKEIKNTEPKERVTTIIEERNGVSFIPNEQKPFTGKHEEFYSNGKKKSAESNYVDGKKNGLFISWYENGKKWFESNYVDGKRNGLFIEWNEDGTKYSETNYVNGNKNGLFIEWNKDGTKYSETNYVNGKINGFRILFLNENGTKSDEKTYVDGKQKSSTSFHKNGQKHIENIYMDDGRELVTIYKNGQKEMEWYSKDGKQITKAKIYKNQEEEANATVQEIISRCRTQMGEHGATMVKACVDQDIEAENALRKY